MPDAEYTIVGLWPILKEDLISFLSDTDAWAIAELKKALEIEDWGRIRNVIEVMDSLHNLSHSH